MKKEYEDPFVYKPNTTYQMIRSYNDESDFNYEDHPVTTDMMNEYIDFIDGKRRYLSFKDTITMGQLQKLRRLYEFNEQTKSLLADIEQQDEEEEGFKKKQKYPVPQYMPVPKAKAKVKAPRKTKWKRYKDRYGVYQLSLRELDKDNK